MLVKRLLKGMELTIFAGDTFNGLDTGAHHLNREYRAALNRAIIDVYDARAALTGIATNVRTRLPEVVADQVHQQRAVFDLGAYRVAVESK